jgi:hypothetical protein
MVAVIDKASILICLSLLVGVNKETVGLAMEISCLNHLFPINRALVVCNDRSANTTTVQTLKDFMSIGCVQEIERKSLNL